MFCLLKLSDLQVKCTANYIYSRHCIAHMHSFGDAANSGTPEFRNKSLYAVIPSTVRTVISTMPFLEHAHLGRLLIAYKRQFHTSKKNPGRPPRPFSSPLYLSLRLHISLNCSAQAITTSTCQRLLAILHICLRLLATRRSLRSVGMLFSTSLLNAQNTRLPSKHNRVSSLFHGLVASTHGFYDHSSDPEPSRLSTNPWINLLRECITIECTLSINGQWEPVVNGHRFGWIFYASISESDMTSPYLSN